MSECSTQARLQLLHHKTLSSVNHILFRHWIALYHQRFPYQELAPVTSIAQSIETSSSVISGVVESTSNRWAGFTLIERYGDSTLLAYLATAPKFEGLGLARELVDEALLKNLTADTPYFWLEANPKLWSFYQKLGFKRLDIEYRIPEFYGSGSEKMGLFVKMYSSACSIPKTVVESFISELFLTGYAITAHDSRYLQQLSVIQAYPHSTMKTL